MICPKCAHEKTEVKATIGGLKRRRFRKCPNCGYTFMTIEAVYYDGYWREYAKEINEREKGENADK